MGESLGESKPHDENLNNESSDHKRREALLQFITNLHRVARRIGEGVTEFAVSMYPPLDLSTKELATKNASLLNGDVDIPSLGSTTLGSQLEYQLHSLTECVLCIKNCELVFSYWDHEQEF